MPSAASVREIAVAARESFPQLKQWAKIATARGSPA